MNYNIVPMTVDHLDEIVELEQRCFADPWSRRMLVDQLENACAATIVAQGEDGTILGYASLLAVLDEGYINNIAVRPEYRRQGVASQLLDVFTRFAKANKLAFLTLEVRDGNLPARAAYAKHGYVEVGRRKNYYDHPKEDAILMTLFFDDEAR